MAEKKTNITTSFSADITGLKKGIQDAKRQIQIANAEFKAASSGMDDWRKSADGLQAKIKQLQTVLANQRDILEKYEQQLALLEKDGKGSTKQADELRIAISNQTAAINKTTKQLDGYESELSQMDDANKKSAESAQKLDDAVEKAGDGFTVFKGIVADLVSSAIKACIQGLADLSKQALETGKNFSSAMSEVAAISGASAEELALLEQTARDFGSSTIFSASEAADALKYMSLAGWDAKTSAEALGGVLNLAAASGMELGEASDMVTDYLTAFGMAASESTYFADLLSYAQSNANTTAAQLGEAFKNSAATLHASGQDVETVTALLASMSNQGLKGSEAGTALAAVMRDITKAMENGNITIGDTIVKVADASGNFRDMTDILADVEAATNGMGDAEKMVALQSTFTARSLKGISLLLNDSAKNTAKFEEALRGAAGTASDMADVMTDNLSGDLTRLNSHFEDIQITLFKQVEPALRELVVALNDFIDEGAKLAQKIIPSLVSGLSWLVNNFNLVLSALSAVAAGFVAWKLYPPIMTAVSIAVDLLTGKLTLATLAQEALNIVMAANPIGLVVTAIAALVAGLAVYIATTDEATQGTVELSEEQQSLIDQSRELSDAVSASADARAKENESIKAQKKLTSNLLNELKKYVDEEGRVVTEQGRAKEIVSELNEIMPELNLVYDEQTGLLSESTAELEKNIAALWKKAEAEAAQAQATEIMRQRIEVETQMLRTEEQVAAAEETVAQAAQLRADKMAVLRQQLADGTIDQIEYDNEVKAAAIAFMDESAAARDVIEANGELQEKLTGLEEEQNALNEIVDGVSSSFTEQGDAMTALADETDETVDRMNSKWQELHDAVADSVEGQVKLFDEYKESNKLTKDEILKNMDDQVAALESWSDNLQTLSKRGIDEGLLQELARLGPDGAGYVAAFVEMSGEELQKANDLFAEAAEIPEATATAVENNYRELGQYRWQAYQTGSKEAGAKIKPELAKDMSESGEMADKGFVEGVDKGREKVKSEFRGVAKDGLDALNSELKVKSPSRETMKTGQFVDEGLALGIKSKVAEPINAAVQLARDVIAALAEALSKDAFIEIGRNVGSGLIEGINDKLEDVKKAAKAVGDEAAKATKDALKVKSPSRVFKYIGEMSGEGYLEGIRETFRGSELEKTFTSVISDVRDGVRGISEIANGTTTNTVNNSTVNNYSFVQNNTSPKALSRLDIYRQTKNQLRYARML